MRILLSILFLLFIYSPSISQNDSLVFKNGNIIVGEVKSLDRGVVVIETDYSDSDFKIDWDEIHKIQTETYFLISFSEGLPQYGRLESKSDSKIYVIPKNEPAIEHDIDNIVFLAEIDQGFKERFSASIDFGVSHTKANNLRQLNSRSMIGYKTEKWASEAAFNTLRSTQEEADTIQRSEAGITFRYLFYRKWYVTATISFLSNTEQKLDLRNNSKVGIGNYIIHTNRSQWGIRTGINRNLERFSNETQDRNSWELFVGTDLDLFDIGDLSLLTNIVAYQGLTETSRFRLDAVFDVKYDLPLDFYLKAGISLNYDNLPAADASELDYIFQTGIGWEW